MSGRSAYVALPGLSTVSILLNLPCIANHSDKPAPVILMDTHDYDRLRGPPPNGAGQSAEKDQYLTMAYDDLRRRGIIRLVDYSNLYPPTLQNRRLRQNRELIEDAPEWVIRRAAVEGIGRWIEFGRGGYQETFRQTLGESSDVFTALRKREKRLQRKMKRGIGDPHSWVEKLLNKDTAALEVCRRADRTMQLDVRGIIASSEYRLPSDFLKLSQSHVESTTDIIDVGRDIDIDASHLEQLNPTRRIAGLDSTVATQTRGLLQIVSNVAADVAEVQHDDWTLFGLSFALPEYNDIFDFGTIQRQLRYQLAVDEVASETEDVLNRLETEPENTLSPSKLTYEADWIAEQGDTSYEDSAMQHRGLTDLVNHAVEVSTYSRELRTLLEEDQVTQAAAFLAVSILNNPFRRYDEDAVYRRSADLMRRLDPPTDNDRTGNFGRERQGETWTENEDWYETVDRDRTPI